MDMNTDVVNIAARRLQVDSVKPVTQRPQTPVEERLLPHTAAEADADVKRKRQEDESAGKRGSSDEYQAEYEGEEETGGEEYCADRPHLGEDGEEHLLDVRV